MATRPVFTVGMNGRLCKPEYTEFQYFNGFAKSQKVKCIQSLHDSFLQSYPGRNVLEISSYSMNESGVRLSAFHLPIRLQSGKEVTVECAFQAGKIFEHGGPYQDLLEKDSRSAKKDPRLKNSGKIIGFYFEGEEFPIIPRTVFYNWLYINALNQQKELADAVMEYDAFTDIVFNPEKQLNCQAEAAAMYVGLRKLGLLEEALKSKEDFLRIGYKIGNSGRLDTGRIESEIAARLISKKTDPGTISVVDPVSEEENMAENQDEDNKQAPEFIRIYHIGDKIKHPRFHVGEVVDVTEKENSAILTIRFPVGEKKLGEEWVQKNCTRAEGD